MKFGHREIEVFSFYMHVILADAAKKQWPEHGRATIWAPKKMDGSKCLPAGWPPGEYT